MDAVLGHRPASDPPIVFDACAGGISVQPSEEEHANECGHFFNFHTSLADDTEVVQSPPKEERGR